MCTHDAKTALELNERGYWRILSTSRTTCYLDLDRMRLLRDRGPGSPVFPYDGRWVPLVQVRSPRGDTTIRVGDRHEFLTDPAGGLHDYQWWIPRTCVEIQSVTLHELPVVPDGRWR